MDIPFTAPWARLSSPIGIIGDLVTIPDGFPITDSGMTVFLFWENGIPKQVRKYETWVRMKLFIPVFRTRKDRRNYSELNPVFLS